MMHSILLVINLHQDLSWRLHLELGPQATTSSTQKKARCPKISRERNTQKSKAATSKWINYFEFVYMIPIWGEHTKLI